MCAFSVGDRARHESRIFRRLAWLELRSNVDIREVLEGKLNLNIEAVSGEARRLPPQGLFGCTLLLFTGWALA